MTIDKNITRANTIKTLENERDEIKAKIKQAKDVNPDKHKKLLGLLGFNQKCLLVWKQD